MRLLSVMICIFLLFSIFTPVIAAEQSGKPAGLPGGYGMVQQAGNQSDRTEGSPPAAPKGEAIRQDAQGLRPVTPVDPAHLREMIRSREEVMGEGVQTLPPQAQERFRHENQVRIAVFALLAAENMTGIGPLVAGVAREYNASVNAQWGDEIRMEERSGIMLVLFGGDRQTAERISFQAEENKRRIEEIRGIILTSSSTDPALSSVLLEQLDQMEVEQRRLDERARIEVQKRGVFSWIYG